MPPVTYWIQSPVALGAPADILGPSASGITRTALGTVFLHEPAVPAPPTGDGVLHGCRVCVKDIIDVAGLPTTYGSTGRTTVPKADAESVARLRAAGARVTSKGNTNEFALGIDGLNPHHGHARNPRDPGRLAGGSSSGPAVAVAAGLADIGLGTDTTGSIRIPAALCGIVGVRVTHGAVPTAGVYPLAPDYDVVGPLARIVVQAARATAVLTGNPALLAWSAADDPAPAAPKELRIGVLRELTRRRCSTDVQRTVYAALDALATAGAQVTELDMPQLAGADDVHMALQLRQAAEVHATALISYRDHYSADVLALLDRGQSFDADQLVAAHQAREQIRRSLAGALAAHGTLALPGAPVVAPHLGATSVELPAGRAELRTALLALAVPFSQAPGPTVALPVGAVDGLPVGLQLHGAPGDELGVLRRALLVEQLLAAEGLT